ncbi:MAG: formylmethanofuran--tetrahydromethanopterin N-formyltransferase [Candidatus Altiarchaeales archaeon ex4484_96]|nr:MAG: formylmethanofuran--tetrahydromethanopterin N-formyltransferase [Candidatus Altiarchaeales archaeon ex4484_96]
MPAQIEDTYAEAFKGLYSHVLITAENKKWLKYAINCATGYASSTIGCGCEAGLDAYLDAKKTPDHRIGALVQFWVPLWGDNPEKRLEKELIARIGQCILTTPTARVFNFGLSGKKLKIGEKIGFYGDGYQKITKKYNKVMVEIPTMMDSFHVEKNLGYDEGIMGGNLWFMASSRKNALTAAEKAAKAISDTEGVITPFPGGVCAAGSKAGSRYKFMKASTHEKYCPTLKQQIDDSRVPQQVESIAEIVFNGVNLKQMKKALKAGINASMNSRGLIMISAGNYGGKLGSHKLYLR